MSEEDIGRAYVMSTSATSTPTGLSKRPLSTIPERPDVEGDPEGLQDQTTQKPHLRALLARVKSRRGKTPTDNGEAMSAEGVTVSVDPITASSSSRRPDRPTIQPIPFGSTADSAIRRTNSENSLRPTRSSPGGDQSPLTRRKAVWLPDNFDHTHVSGETTPVPESPNILEDYYRTLSASTTPSTSPVRERRRRRPSASSMTRSDCSSPGPNEAAQGSHDRSGYFSDENDNHSGQTTPVHGIYARSIGSRSTSPIHARRKPPQTSRPDTQPSHSSLGSTAICAVVTRTHAKTTDGQGLPALSRESKSSNTQETEAATSGATPRQNREGAKLAWRSTDVDGDVRASGSVTEFEEESEGEKTGAGASRSDTKTGVFGDEAKVGGGSETEFEEDTGCGPSTEDKSS